jgi:gluconate 2-dehydrogenase gamma chain
MERRDLFRVLTATALAGSQAEAQHAHVAPKAGAQAAQAPRFFTAAQHQTVEQLCEMLLPADAMGPGAKQAGVPGFIDTLLVYAGEGVRNQWRAGVAAVDDAARREFDKAFVECGHDQQAAIMRLLAENEAAPETELQCFFAVFKRTAVEGFGLSLVGRRALGYRGNTAIRSFPGCTHREHQRL